MTTENKKHELFSNELLNYFTGSENLYKHWTSRINYTDGIKYLADKADSYWLIDMIASHIPTLLKKAPDIFYSIFLEVDAETNKAEFYITNGNNDNKIIKQKISYSDFPLDKIHLFMCLSVKQRFVLMLPREY